MTEKEGDKRLTKQNGQSELNRAAAAEIAKMFPDGNLDENAVVDMINEAYGADIFLDVYDRNGNQRVKKAYDVWNHNSPEIRSNVTKMAVEMIEKRRTFKIDGFTPRAKLAPAVRWLAANFANLYDFDVEKVAALYPRVAKDIQHTVTTGEVDQTSQDGKNLMVVSTKMGSGKSTSIRRFVEKAAGIAPVAADEVELPRKYGDLTYLSKNLMVAMEEYRTYKYKELDGAAIEATARRGNVIMEKKYHNPTSIPGRAIMLCSTNDPAMMDRPFDERTWVRVNTIPASIASIRANSKYEFDEDADLFGVDPRRLDALEQYIKSLENDGDGAFDKFAEMSNPVLDAVSKSGPCRALFDSIVANIDKIPENGTVYSGASLARALGRNDAGSVRDITKGLDAFGGVCPRVGNNGGKYLRRDVSAVLDAARNNSDLVSALDGDRRTDIDDIKATQSKWEEIIAKAQEIDGRFDGNGGGNDEEKNSPPSPGEFSTEDFNTFNSNNTKNFLIQKEKTEKVFSQSIKKSIKTQGDAGTVPSPEPVLREMPDFRMTDADLLALRQPVIKTWEWDEPDPSKPDGVNHRLVPDKYPTFHMDGPETHIVCAEYRQDAIDEFERTKDWEVLRRNGVNMRPAMYLFEADHAPLEEQKAIFERVLREHPEAVASVCLSGGKSVHMLVNIPKDERDLVAKDFQYYNQKAAERLFGNDMAIFDDNAHKCVQLARMPGAWRPYKGARQTALYINWTAPGLSLKDEITVHEAEREKAAHDRMFNDACRRMNATFSSRPRRTGNATPLDRLKAMQRKKPTDARAFAIDILEGGMIPSGSGMVRAIRSVKYLAENVDPDFEDAAREVYDRCRDAHPSNICSAYEDL